VLSKKGGVLPHYCSKAYSRAEGEEAVVGGGTNILMTLRYMCLWNNKRTTVNTLVTLKENLELVGIGDWMKRQ
jgi:hypothetical protein